MHPLLNYKYLNNNKIGYRHFHFPSKSPQNTNHIFSKSCYNYKYKNPVFVIIKRKLFLCTFTGVYFPMEGALCFLLISLASLREIIAAWVIFSAAVGVFTNSEQFR